MILVVEVEKWLFVNKQQADQATVPTILVEKDQHGAKWFTSMRILFQLKKWTSKRRFVPFFSCDETTYRAYEVFHVDALPSMTLLDRGRTLLIDNQKDEAYSDALLASAPDSDVAVVQFALRYIEAMSQEPVVTAIDVTNIEQAHVPEALFVAADQLESGRRLFDWANRQDTTRGGTS